MRQWKQPLFCAAALLLALALLLPAALAVAPAAETPPAPAAETAAPADAAPVDESWKLALVNPWNPVEKDASVELVSLKNGLQVDARIYDDLNAMLIDCWAAGLQPVVCSAYRTEETQTRLYKNKVARLRAVGYSRAGAQTEAARWVAVPGTSEHHTGLALDLVSAGYQLLNEQQARTPEQQWLMEHCWDYGFILRYPSDKSAVTGIGYEPWHYRYVGREAATAIRDQGVCLEEYLAAQAAAKTPETAPAIQSAVGSTPATGADR